MPTVGLALHPSRVDAQAMQLLAAAPKDVRVVGREADAGRLPPGVAVVSDEVFRAEVDAVISLGGDGTMLGAMRLVAERPVPVLGVNTGHLGFLVEVQPAGLKTALHRLKAGDFTIEEHHGLRVDAGGLHSTAFNDVVLAKSAGSSVGLDLAIGPARYGYYRCDAVVVATPHGSTAYSFAAGGPVVSPAAAVLVVTPVAPMSGIGRPVVLAGSEQVVLTAERDGAPARIELDGVPAGDLPPGTAAEIRLMPGAGQVVRLDPEAHAARNRVKLSLLDLPLRQDQLLELIPPELRAR